MSIHFSRNIANPEHDAIIGLLLTLSAQSATGLAATMENAARAQNARYSIDVTWGLHHQNPDHITVVLHDGDNDPTEIHIYVTYIEIGGNGDDSDSDGEGVGHMSLDFRAAPGIGKPAGTAFSTPAFDGGGGIAWI